LYATPMQAGLSGNVSLFVRPESILLSRAANGIAGYANRLQGTVESVLFDGANSSVRVREAGSGCALLVALPQSGQLADLVHGEPVHLGIRAEHVQAFPDARA
jgi:spermidine/putrescine transport system ATP-binding protein